jgi:tetratricopeptide (TPR) repeat protein
MKFKLAFGISTTLLVAAMAGNILQSTEAAPVQKPAAKKTSAPAQDADYGAAVAYFNQGVGATNAKNYLQAVQLYKASRDADPDYLNAYVNEASSYLSLNRPDLAIDTASKGIARCNKNNDDNKMVWEILHQNRGNAYIHASREPKEEWLTLSWLSIRRPRAISTPFFSLGKMTLQFRRRRSWLMQVAKY